MKAERNPGNSKHPLPDHITALSFGVRDSFPERVLPVTRPVHGSMVLTFQAFPAAVFQDLCLRKDPRFK